MNATNELTALQRPDGRQHSQHEHSEDDGAGNQEDAGAELEVIQARLRFSNLLSFALSHRIKGAHNV